MEGFTTYIESLEDRILALENYLINIESQSESEESEESTKMKLSYYPNWRNDLLDSISDYTHITHCFINEPKHFTTIQLIPNKKNGISIGGWNDKDWIIQAISKNNDYLDSMIEEANAMIGLDFFNLDIEYPLTNEWARKMCKYVRENLSSNIKLCVACGLWKGFAELYKGCDKYLDWIELMAYDNDIKPYIEETLQTLNRIGFSNDKIVIGYSNDRNGDTEESLKYKQNIINDYLGIMLWNNPVGPTFDINFDEESESESEELGEIILWQNKWDNPYRKMNKARQKDPYDAITCYRGSGGYVEINQGILKLSGNQPRLYINVDVKNIEVSLDYMRVKNDGKGWSGGTIGIRSDIEGHSLSPEKAHTYYMRLKHSGHIELYRELIHGGNGDSLIIKPYKWDSNEWYNMKFRCFNEDNKVKIEMFINNKLELEYEDDNQVMYQARGIVFIRNTSVNEAFYKNMIVKSI